MTANASIQAENERLRRVMSDPRILGLEVAAATLALGSPSLSAEQVVESVANAAAANGFNRTAGLSAAIDDVIAKHGTRSLRQAQGDLFEGMH
ncbi:hypothetical protein [Microvirga sp. CF3016]|uniref:hypothetical protein n=1 Tax=Microvirga sp. CF3016 TaxID=3110181 RepID=UPI002E78DC52|nr:hypothetical protein [Microvirga sp. CF3016]MEE1611115.1 hypothetical protein [Microvirga sp. CF3016]